MPELDLKEMLSQAAGNEPTPAADPIPAEPVPADPIPADPIPADPVPAAVPVENPDKPGFDMDGKPYVAPVADPEPEPDPVPKPNPIKDVRDQLNATKKAKELVTNTMNKFVAGSYEIKLADHMLEDGTGIDYESLGAAMEKVDIAKRAEGVGLTPEVQAAVEQIEKDKIEIQKQKLQLSMDKALTNLQMDKALKEGDINNFFKDAMESKKNPYQWIAQGGTLADLYNLIYADKIKQNDIDAAVATAKAKWEADAAAANRVPKGNPGQAVVKKAVAEGGKTMKELLAEAAENRR